MHHFLALAFTDQAFATIASRADIEAEVLDPSQDLRVYPHKPECRTRPFLICPKGEPLTYQRFWYQLKELSYRSGYVEHIQLIWHSQGHPKQTSGMQLSVLYYVI
jgi:hypothetical protein